MATDIVFFYFEVGTMAPISLLELGLCLSANKKIFVVCDPGFWREANVHVTAEFFKRGPLPQNTVFTDMEEGVEALQQEVALYALSREEFGPF